MKTIPVTQIKAGDTALAGYRYRDHLDNLDKNLSIGFKVGNQFFNRLQHVKEFFGVKNLKQLEEKAKEQELGCVTAEWKCLPEEGQMPEYIWGAYLWGGSFRVGTSADRLVIRSV